MLELNNIVKDYISGDTRVTALKELICVSATANLYQFWDSPAAEKQLC